MDRWASIEGGGGSKPYMLVGGDNTAVGAGEGDRGCAVCYCTGDIHCEATILFYWNHGANEPSV